MIQKVIKAPLSGTHSYYLLKRKKPLVFNENNIVDIPALDINHSALAHLLDSGVVLSPDTVFNNFYVLNAGDEAAIDGSNVDIKSNQHFAFSRSESKQNKFFMKEFESAFYGSLEKHINPNSNSILFLSAGKDSVSIAIGLSQMHDMGKIHAITYKSSEQDESQLASKITKKLNLSHEIVDITSYYVSEDKLINFFSTQLLPSIDLCATIYLHCGLERFYGSQIVDGMGNDLFIGHIPSRQEWNFAERQKYIPYPLKRIFGSFHNCHKAFMIASKTRAEMVGMWTYLSDSQLIDELLPFSERRKYWEVIDSKFRNSDYLDVRAELRGRYIDQEKFIRKIKNAAVTFGLEPSFPWTDLDLAHYCFNLADCELFDKRNLVNKLFLRSFISNKIGIDYHSEPKYAFSYNYSKFVTDNKVFINNIIFESDLFSKKNLSKEVNKFYKSNNYGAIYQLFLVLGWYQFSRYIAR